jgi:site-specific DNA-methyltransferase (adenine-specific)
MKIETLAIADLKPDPQNARQHDDKNLKAIEGSLNQFGQRKPIVITEGNVIVAGNGTVTAAKNLGWEKIEAVRVPADWSKDQVKAFALADNRTAELATWSPEVLAAQLIELEDAGFEIAEFGFEALEMPTQDETTTEDDVPESVPQRSSLGDHWKIGDVELYVLDAFTAELPTSDAVISDPPYGMNVDFSWYGGPVGKSLGRNIEIASKHSELEKPDWDQKKFDPTRFIGHAKTTALFGANYFYEYLPADGTWWVWDKRQTESGEIQNAYGMPYEMLWINGKRKSNIIRNLWAGFTRKATAEDKERLHPTQKPYAVMSEIIIYLTKEGDVVLDPFAGSGTTLLACVKNKRKAIGIEFDPKFADVILARLEKETGEKAELLPAKAD